MTWRTEAACADTDTTIFYPAVSTDTTRTRKRITDPYAQARLVCDRCPVKDDCYADAVTTEDHHGFRGGHTPDELHRAIHGPAGTVTRHCAWCGVLFRLGKFHNLRTKYCSNLCRRAQERAVNKQRRRDRGGRAAA